jgi:hypothetical protein
MEIMSEVVQLSWPEWTFRGLQSVSLFQGIKFEEEPRDIRVIAESKQNVGPDLDVFEVDVTILDSDKKNPPCYRAAAQMGKTLSSGFTHTPPDLSTLRPFPMKVDEVYEKWLFHGPSMQGISKIEGINEKGMCALLVPSSPDACLNRTVHGRWLVDPVVIDSAFQLSILWERFHYNMTPLISSVKSYERFELLSDAPVRCWAQTKSMSGGHYLLTDFFFLDKNGRLIALIKAMEASCRRELNRLATAFRERR